MKLILSLIFIATSVVASEVGSPKWIVESFFSSDHFPNKEKYYTGEMTNYLADANMGSRMPTNVTTQIRSLDNESIFAITYSDGTQEANWYCFLKKEEGEWKLEAVRTLAQQEIVYQCIYELSQKERTEDEEWDYQNMLLQVSSDSKLKQYLKDNLLQFEKMISDPGKKDETAHSLHLDSAIGHTFLIGGILDNSVGFLYVPKDEDPPQPSSGDGYIYIEHITGNWYIYKTT
jgi:hypothetical protein